MLDALRATGEYSKKAFKAYKIAAIADATVSAYKGAAKTLGAYPWPIGGALAAAHLAVGLAQVRNINSTSSSGGSAGGSISAGGGSTADVNSTNVGAVAPTTTDAANDLAPAQTATFNVYSPRGSSQEERYKDFLYGLNRAKENDDFQIDENDIIVNYLDDATAA